MGQGLMAIFMGLFLHPVFSFVGFLLICTFLVALLGSLIGALLGLDMDSPPGWFFLSALAISAVLAGVFRKHVPKLMRWAFFLLIGGLALAVVAMIVRGIMLSGSR